jgi:hypothetical protein
MPMRRSLGLLVVGAAVLGLTGCGDSSKTVLRDYITLWNEYNDNVARIPYTGDNVDEAAEDLAKVKFKGFKKRMEYILHRMEVLHANPDADTRRELKAAVEYWESDIKQAYYIVITKDNQTLTLAGDRPKQEIKRLTEIIDRLAREEAVRQSDPPRKRGVVFRRGIQKEEDFNKMIAREAADLEQHGIQMVPVIWEKVAPNVHAVLIGYDDLGKVNLTSTAPGK